MRGLGHTLYNTYYATQTCNFLDIFFFHFTEKLSTSYYKINVQTCFHVFIRFLENTSQNVFSVFCWLFKTQDKTTTYCKLFVSNEAAQ